MLVLFACCSPDCLVELVMIVKDEAETIRSTLLSVSVDLVFFCLWSELLLTVIMALAGSPVD